MTNMAALGTLVSLITTTFSRLPSSGIRQESKSSGLFMPRLLSLQVAPAQAHAAAKGCINLFLYTQFGRAARLGGEGSVVTLTCANYLR